MTNRLILRNAFSLIVGGLLAVSLSGCGGSSSGGGAASTTTTNKTSSNATAAATPAKVSVVTPK